MLGVPVSTYSFNCTIENIHKRLRLDLFIYPEPSEPEYGQYQRRKACKLIYITNNSSE